jgi:hypothetical protein
MNSTTPAPMAASRAVPKSVQIAAIRALTGSGRLGSSTSHFGQITALESMDSPHARQNDFEVGGTVGSEDCSGGEPDHGGGALGAAPSHLRGTRIWWTDERLETALRRFAEGHEVFPTRREFRRASQTGLLVALHRHGGLELWAARFGLPRREPHSGRIVARA